MSAPLGTTFLRWARRWLDGGSVEQIVEPMIADARHDRSTRSQHGRGWTALRWRAAFLVTFACGVGRSPLRPAAWAPLFNVAPSILAFAAVGALLEFIAFWIQYPDATRAAPLLLAPAFITAGLPLALLPAVMRLMSDRRWRPWQARTAAACIVACALAITIPVNGWIRPTTNQMFRVHAARAMDYAYPPARGDGELTLPELFADRPPAGTMVSPRQLAAERQLRTSRLVAPITLALLGAAFARLGIAGRMWHTVAAWAIVGQLWGVLIGAGAWIAAAIVGVGGTAHSFDALPDIGRFAAWTPHLMLLSTAVLCHRVASAREVARS